MPITTTIDPAQRLCTAVLTEDVRTDELLEEALCLFNDPAWRPGFSVLWDGSQLRRLLIHPGDERAFFDLARVMSGQIGGGCMAWVYSRDVDHLAARYLFAQLQRPEQMAYGFRSHAAALRWIARRRVRASSPTC